ncbi:TIGR03747 family integrating conjugative element membrane protein [Ectothiorhodospira variabilis]|uniref:TIGR03747 family integrating conjugative element membrane protein n=1 Tax=Ectothiorhodospira variabilis TaxID=505694 RepID=UPI001EFC00A3|nr:TIGR03747 family integrating conjugative element membrane protein [Ectothiorhodospira variabilis]MCG5495553.1 TIGR03747 family integrating conjugative element membrane protein [Ectothiorhodospira variabilis]MCG5505161.1 TIGR03747 family integrating conjugative element membrane protein [Ectothiorhodospira variabilis]MCG5508318.1 TIGR03747 family integrating conjugative element membrane protein [Ectothiorhodospira variabilis]
MSTAARQARDTRHPVQQGLLSRTLSAVASILFWLFVALLFSILAEWVGMWLWWPDEGVDHSRQMLEQEIRYVNQDFGRSLLVSEPADYARQFADTSYHLLFEMTRVEPAIQWLSQPVDPRGSTLQATLRQGYGVIEAHVVAAMTITQVFAVRLAVLTLAMPVFVLFGLVAIVDGLVQRDLRRWTGGRESSFVYHHAKRLILPSIILTWVVYLGMPVSVHPNYVVLPFALLTALALAVTASTFKKYL